MKNHRSNVTSQDKWYPRAMFEAFSSEFNMKGQAVVGFAKSARGKIQVGKIIYQQLPVRRKMEVLILLGLIKGMVLMDYFMVLRRTFLNYVRLLQI